MPLRRPVGLVALLAMAASLLALSPVSAQAAPSPNLVLSQVYGGGGNTGAPLTNDYVELFNRGGTSATTTGLSVQYASATGTGNLGGTSSQLVVLPDRTVPAGGYLLVQLAGGTAGTALPAPDATGSINMSGTAGKVALVTGTAGLGCNGGSTPCTTEQLARIVDLVGYGAANFFEGSGPAPTLSNTTAAIRAGGGCTDSDQNAADFTAAAPAPRSSATTPAPCGGVVDPGPAQPVANCEASLAVTTGTAGSTGVDATDADSRIVAAAITSPAVSGITLDSFAASTAVGTPGSATLNVADTTAAGTYPVAITFSTDDDPAQTATCTVEVVVSDPAPVTPISVIQGSGTASPRAGETVTAEAVVTSLITASDVSDGFFVQEQDADADNDPATSEGVYVFCRGNCPASLAAGDLVRVTGVVAEFSTSTQINATAGTVAVVGSGLPLPTAAVVTLPAATSTKDAATFENVEGMRTTISTTLAVSEYFNLARFGEIVLTAGERPYQFTHTSAPDTAGYTAFLNDLATRRIILDDNSNDQNDATSGPRNNEPYYYPTPGLSTGNFFRGGDTTTGLTGVFEYAFGAWKLRPVAGADYTFTPANPRPAAPDAVGGRLKVASFNVLNYFTTIDATPPSQSAGPCGATGTLDCRGADSVAELDRQRAKIVAAMVGLDADVLGLIEIQNDDDVAVADLVAALNAATAPGTYDVIRTGVVGTDAIKQAFVYRPASVTPVGLPAVLDSTVNTGFDTTRNRPALAQSFDEVGTGARFTAVVNHLKSKGSACGPGNDSPLDGSGNCDGTRTAAAQALAEWLATDPTGSGDPDVLVIGDLNSYRNERPITTLEAAGYTDLLERFVGDAAYTYVFDGQLGYLDYALANPALNAQVTGATSWHTNADEIPLLDYNDTVLDAGEASFERESSALPLYQGDPFRASDHDAVVVGLALNRAPVADAGGPYTTPAKSNATLDASGSTDPDGDLLSYAWDLDGDGLFDDATGPTVLYGGDLKPGLYTVSVQVSDGEFTSADTATLQVVKPGRTKPPRGLG